MIFMNFLARSSRTTGPKMRVPIGSFCLLISTAALRSKRITEPSARRMSLAVRTTTARVTFDGEASLSSRAYPWLGTKPPASARVLLLPVGRGYVILGALSA